MNIPTHFEGEIYFYYWPFVDGMFLRGSETQDDDFVFLGKKHIRADFDTSNVTKKAVESLEKKIERERADSACRVQALKYQISSLLALEHKPEVEA